MIGLLRNGVLAMAISAASVPAHAGELCGWLVESLQGDDVHQFELWLQAEKDTDVFYRMTGRGIVSDSASAYAPGSGTYALHAREPVKVWGFGSTLSAPATIDIVAEIHAPPKDVFADAPTPLLATFSFRREVEQGERGPPQLFAARQCVVVGAKG